MQFTAKKYLNKFFKDCCTFCKKVQEVHILSISLNVFRTPPPFTYETEKVATMPNSHKKFSEISAALSAKLQCTTKKKASRLPIKYSSTSSRAV